MQSVHSEILGRISRDKRAIFGLALITAFVGMALFAPFLTPYRPDQIVGSPYANPSQRFWLGTDNLGQDIMSQVLYGSRVSLLVGVVVAVAVTGIGTLVGLFAGYYRGTVDESLMRATDIMLILPPLPLMIILAAYLGPSIESIIGVLTVTSWPLVARVIRSQTLSLRERPFVDSARVIGSGNLRIMFTVIFPNLLTLIAANVVLMITTAVVGEAGLDFIGLGSPATVSWGTMLYWAQSYALFNGAWWWVIAPGLSIALLGMGAVLISVSIENVFNPRMRTR